MGTPDHAQIESFADKYTLQEMKLLRGEVELRGKEHREMEKYVVLGSAAIYAFVFGKDHGSDSISPTFVRLALFIPPLLGAFAYFRWFESIRMIDRLARYIARVEQRVLGEQGGWETYLVDERWKTGPGMTPLPYVWLWIVLIPGTLLFAAAWPGVRDVPSVCAALASPMIALGLHLHMKDMQAKWQRDHPKPH